MDKFRLQLEKFFDKVEIPYMALGFAYLGIFTTQVLVQPPQEIYRGLEIASDVIYWIFALDVVLRAIYLGKRLLTIEGIITFFRQNWLGLASLLLPAFRSLRVLRVLLVLRGLAPFMHNRATKVGLVVGVTLPLLIFTSAVSVLEAERGVENANIHTFPDAIWWALASVTTVGYGDRFPVTDDGRFVATLLMLVGIGLFSSLTALLAAWVLGENQKKEEQKLEAVIKESVAEAKKPVRKPAAKKAPQRKPATRTTAKGK
jgi:voltage-gated potassium channel